MFKGLLEALITKIGKEYGSNSKRAEMKVDEMAFTDDAQRNCELVLDAVNHADDVIYETVGISPQRHCILFVKSLIDDQVLRNVYDKGSDAVLPYLRLGKEDVLVDGVALFYDDRYVGRLN